jgi:hypothetical protein
VKVSLRRTYFGGTVVKKRRGAKNNAAGQNRKRPAKNTSHPARPIHEGTANARSILSRATAVRCHQVGRIEVPQNGHWSYGGCDLTPSLRSTEQLGHAPHELLVLFFADTYQMPTQPILRQRTVCFPRRLQWSVLD